MPVETEETYGRAFSDKDVSREYLVTGTTDEDTAKAAALAEAPTTAGGFETRRTYARELYSKSDTAGAWLITVTWSSGDDDEPTDEEIIDELGGYEYSFEISPASYLVKQSRSTVGYYPNAAGTPRFGGAINVDSKGNVQGVQWPPPAQQVFSQTATITPDSVTQSYYRQLCALAGSVNDDTFLGFASGELIFLGASGTRRGLGNWKITFNFGFLPNESSIAVDWITVTTKNGWDILWVYYTAQEHSDGSDVVAVVQKPVAAYVERVGLYSDFGTLEPTGS